MEGYDMEWWEHAVFVWGIVGALLLPLLFALPSQEQSSKSATRRERLANNREDRKCDETDALYRESLLCWAYLLKEQLNKIPVRKEATDDRHKWN